MLKVLSVAWREFKSTALTPAFLIGALLPLVIWGAIAAVGVAGLLDSKKEPMSGIVAVIDETEGEVVTRHLRFHYSPEEQERRAEDRAEAAKKALEESPMAEMVDENTKQIAEAAARDAVTIGEVEIRTADPAEFEGLKADVGAGELLALVMVDEQSIDYPESREAAREIDRTDFETGGTGVFRVLHTRTLDTDHLDDLQDAVDRAIKDQRYRRDGIDPEAIKKSRENQPIVKSGVAGADGTAGRSTAVLDNIVPLVFVMLVFMASITGGSYLLMGTIEEKGSRVMEVLLSAVSPTQLLIGKLIGQGAVGLSLMVMYGLLGVGVSAQFGMFGQLPLETVPWLVLYFLIAYLWLGAMFVAVGSAVTEIREAQALYAPINLSTIIPMVLMIPALQNPDAMLAKVTSYIPGLMPFIMAVRVSQPAHPVPMWELFATGLAGVLGVLGVIWFASKVFRVGVLMYGQPPSLIGIFKWMRYT